MASGLKLKHDPNAGAKRWQDANPGPFIKSEPPFRSRDCYPIKYTSGPVELLPALDGIAKNYGSVRVVWDTVKGFNFHYDDFDGKKLATNPGNLEPIIAAFKRDVALFAQKNPKIRKFVMEHREMGVQL